MQTSDPAITRAEESTLPPGLSSFEQQDTTTSNVWILWRHSGFLWRVIWKTAVLATVVAFLIPSRYRSTATLVPSESSSLMMSGLLGRVGGTSGASAASGLGMNAASLLGLKTPGAFYIEVLRSRTVQDRLINRFDLRKVYWRKDYKDTRKKLKKYTDIEEDKKSGVITLSVTDKDPKRAAALARAYIEEMNRVAASLNTSAAHREREFLEERLKEAKQDLDQASMELSQFSSKNSVMDVQNQGRSMMDAAARLQGELIASEAELKGLQQTYSDDNVRVRTVKARIAELRAQLKKLVGNYTDPGSADAAQGSSRLYPSIRTLPALGYRYSDLYRKAKIQEAVYEFLTQQYEMARIQEAKEVPMVRVLDEGDVPEKRYFPIRSLIVGLSVLGALLLACWWLVAKQKWDQLPLDHSSRLLWAEVFAESKRLLKKIGRNRAQAPA